MAISQKIQDSLGRSSWIRKMFEEGDRLRKEWGPDRVFDFTLGNPDLEPPEVFRESLRELATNPVPGMHKYMNNAGYPETRRAVAAYLSKLSGKSLNENHVVMTCGAGGGLNVVLKALLNPGEEVVCIAPYFVEYGFYVDNHQGRLVVVKSGPDFLPDIAALGAAITPKTKAIIINSPNNPTGVVYPAETLEAIERLLAEKERQYGTEIYLVSDEPYTKLVYDGVKVPPVFKYVRRSILVTSHSKDLALPGERIGYVAINPDIPEADQLFNGLVFANRILGFVNAPAMMKRLIAPLQEVAAGVDAYRERRDILVDHLCKVGFKLIKPQGAFYIFPQSPEPDDVAFINKAASFGLLLVPGSGFGLPGYFRIAYCVDKEMILRSLPVFTRVAEEYGLTRR